MVRPCFFFRAPDIAPRTLCICQSSDLLICSTVAPSGRRSMASSWASLVLDLDGACLLVLALLIAGPAETFFLLIMDSFALHLAGVVAGAPMHSLPVPTRSSRIADHAIAIFADRQPFHGWSPSLPQTDARDA